MAITNDAVRVLLLADASAPVDAASSLAVTDESVGPEDGCRLAHSSTAAAHMHANSTIRPRAGLAARACLIAIKGSEAAILRLWVVGWPGQLMSVLLCFGVACKGLLKLA